MESELLIAILAGLGGLLGWGFADFFAKITIDKVGDIVSLTWGHFFGSAALILMALYQVFVGGQALIVPTDFTTLLFLVLFGIGQATVYIFVYRGFGKGQVALLSPIFATFSGITAVLSIVVFAEIVTGFIGLGLLTLFAGIMMMSLDIEALRNRRISFTRIPGFKDIITATALAALWTLFWGKFLGGADWLSYTLIMYVVMTLAIFAYAKFQKLNLSNITPNMWKYLALIGICETGAYLAISLGYSFTSRISIIALLSSAFSIPVIVLARIFLKEKITRLQTIGSLVVVAGIMLLSII